MSNKNEELLDQAKLKFFHAVLANDTLAQLVLDIVNRQNARVFAVGDLPGILAEPRRQMDRIGPTRLGMRFSMSLTLGDDYLPELATNISVYAFLDILILQSQRSERTLLLGGDGEEVKVFFDASDALWALDMPAKERALVAQEFMCHWVEFMRTADSLGAYVNVQQGIVTTEHRAYSTCR